MSSSQMMLSVELHCFQIKEITSFCCLYNMWWQTYTCNSQRYIHYELHPVPRCQSEGIALLNTTDPVQQTAWTCSPSHNDVCCHFQDNNHSLKSSLQTGWWTIDKQKWSTWQGTWECAMHLHTATFPGCHSLTLQLTANHQTATCSPIPFPPSRMGRRNGQQVKLGGWDKDTLIRQQRKY